MIYDSAAPSISVLEMFFVLSIRIRRLEGGAGCCQIHGSWQMLARRGDGRHLGIVFDEHSDTPSYLEVSQGKE